MVEQARLDVAAHVNQLKIRPAIKELGLAPQTAGADDGAFGQLHKPLVFARNESVAGRAALRHGGERQTRDGERRQVLQAMDGNIDAAVEQRVLDGLG